jgi:hypothetical protein
VVAGGDERHLRHPVPVPVLGVPSERLNHLNSGEPRRPSCGFDSFQFADRDRTPEQGLD